MEKKNLFCALSTLLLAFGMMFVSCSDDDNNNLPYVDNPFNGKEVSFEDPSKVQLPDYVKNEGIFTIDDATENAALDAIAELVDGWEEFGGGCSAASKKLGNGDLVFGRNMDLTLSIAPAHIFMTTGRTYKTVNLQYFPLFDADLKFDEIPELNGLIKKSYYPFVSTDVMNEKGLYMQTNMRNVEDKYACTGTNPGKTRIFMACLGQYVCSRCATVDEAIKLIETLDIYSGCNPLPNFESLNWIFAWNMGDAQGNRALVEIAKNKVFVTKNNEVHTNFFINKELQEKEALGTGYGRYECLKEGLPGVRSEMDMHNLLQKVYYWNIFTTCAKDPKNAPYDMRSEWVGGIPVNDKGEVDEENGKNENCTYQWVTDPNNAEVVYGIMQEQSDGLTKLPEQALRDNLLCWKSVFHVVANCTQKKLTFSFYEKDDENNRFTYRFK